VTISRLSRYLVSTFVLCCLSAIVLVGCGSSSNTTTTTSMPTGATGTACAQLRSSFRPAMGTIQSVTGQTVHITESNGGSINAIYSNTTHIIQQTVTTTSALQKGVNVNIQTQPNSNSSSYTATTITLMQAGQFGQTPNRMGRQTGDNTATACFGNGQGQRRATGNGGGQANSQSIHRVVGTIGQINGNTLTITDRQQKTYTITLASDTKIIQSTSTTSSAIQPNMGISVTGTNNNGVITAMSMSIYPAGLLPTLAPTQTNS
jgi:hypothetical protein